MQHVLLERHFDPAISADDFRAMALEGIDCMPLYRVQWRESSAVGRWQPPAVPLRGAGCRVGPHGGPGFPPQGEGRLGGHGPRHRTGRQCHGGGGAPLCQPVALEDLQAIEAAAAWCLEQYRVTYLRTFFSVDGSRMICLYRAPDAESVRLAQSEAELPVERVWPCRGFTPADFAG